MGVGGLAPHMEGWKAGMLNGFWVCIKTIMGTIHEE